MSDPRFCAYRRHLSHHIARNYQHLRDQLQPPLTLAPLHADCFALADAAALGIDDADYASP